MKRACVILVLLMLTILTLLTGCSSNVLNNTYPKDLNILHNSNYQIIKLQPDW